MDKKEFATFAMALKTYYPREQLLPNQQAMELWYRELCDIPYNVAEASLRKWVSMNKWSPTIADMREMYLSVAAEDIPDWSEAWAKVIQAVRDYGIYQQRKAMDSLDELTRSCAERVGYRNICLSENISVERANFRMIYESMAAREKENNLLPGNLRTVIDELIGNEQLKLKG